MKTLIIHTERETAFAKRVKAALTKPGTVVETLIFPAAAKGENVPAVGFLAFFTARGSTGSFPAHTLVLSPLSGRFLDFLAGFASGSRLPFLVYGEAAEIGAAYPEYFKTLGSEAELFSYFEAEYEAFKKWEEGRLIVRARETLLEMGIPVNEESLAVRAAEGTREEVTLFLEAGFSPNAKNKNGVPLLCLAARKGNREVLDLLIASGAEIDMLAADRGGSALIDSVMARQYDITRTLVKAGSDVNIRNKDGQSALILSVGNDNMEIVEFFIKAGSDPEIPDNLGMSARQYAALFNKSALTALFDAYTPGKAG